MATHTRSADQTAVTIDTVSSGPRHDARVRYQLGEIDKHQYAALLRPLNQDLAEYCRFITSTEISSITLTDDEIQLESRIAPVRFSCDLDDPSVAPMVTLALGTYEPLQMRTLLVLLAKAEGFFDVGANVGWYSMHAARLFPQLRVVAFEPVAQSFRRLARNIELNELSITAENFGLSRAEEIGLIYTSPTQSGAASIKPSRQYADQVSEPIVLSTLDRYAGSWSHPIDVVKLDVEGAELLVLEGGLETLQAHRPAVLAEMLRLHSAPYGYHPNAIIDLMSDLGYRCFACSSRGWIPFASMDDQTVETDFLFLHGDRHADVVDEILALSPARTLPPALGT